MRPRRSTISVPLLATALVAGSCSCFVHIRSCWQRHERNHARHVVNAFDIGNALGSMANSILGGGDKGKNLPVTAAEVLGGCKDALQVALEQGYGKLDIEVPRGLSFGYESTRQSPVMFEKSMRSRSRGLASERELAYAFVTMLAPMAETVCVGFQTPEMAAAAKREWNVDNMQSIMKTKIRVLALGGAKSGTGKGAGAFGSQRRAAMEATKSEGPGLALGTRLVKMECTLFVAVAPSPASLIAISDVSNILGDNMGIVLLNARIHGRHRHEKLPDAEFRKLRKTFVPAYHLRFLEPDTDTVLYHKAMEADLNTWIVAKQPKDDLARVTYKELLRTQGAPSRAQLAAVRERNPSPVTTG